MPPPNFALHERFNWEDFCSRQIPVDNWYKEVDHVTSAEFMRKLGLSTVYPACLTGNFTTGQGIPQPPIMGPLEVHDYHRIPVFDLLITTWKQATPALLAMSELWLRLFASAIAPLGIIVMMWEVVSCFTSGSNSSSTSSRQSAPRKTIYDQFILAVSILSVASSLVLTTDTYYVYEFGAERGLSYLIFSSMLTAALAMQRPKAPGRAILLPVLGFFFLLFAFLVYDASSSTGCCSFGDSSPTNVPEGVYYNQKNKVVRKAVEEYWPEERRTYKKEVATPWCPTGDSRTGIPFLVNFWPDLKRLHRVWLPTQDGEAVRLDISFPPNGHDSTKTIYLILHGLNGGSQEEFIKDMVNRRTAEGHTCVIMIARGLMDTPIIGWSVFHGARVSDCHETAVVLRNRVLARGQALAGVGYSMGAIIISNYMAEMGRKNALDVGVCVSGGLYMMIQKYFYRAQRLWQPMLTMTLREQFVLGKYGERYRSRLTRDNMLRLMQSTHITELDQHGVVEYNSYDSLDHYYTDMSAMGDYVAPKRPEDSLKDEVPQDLQLKNLGAPLLVIHALDDPLITWETVAADDGLRHPDRLVEEVSPNLVLLLTKRGGHVGWPLGWFPWQRKWEWMNEASSSFIESVVQAKGSL